MSDIEQITHIIFTNFDIAYILSINMLTYTIIKIIDCFNGDKKVSLGVKRLVTIGAAIVCCVLYKCFTDSSNSILINSTIAAPVTYSWLLKSIIKKLGIGYKSDKNNVNKI